jgi:hypothetical protein
MPVGKEKGCTYFLDLDEIGDLSRAITYLKELSEKWNGVKKEYISEVKFSTNRGLQIILDRANNDIRPGSNIEIYVCCADGRNVVTVFPQHLESMKNTTDKALHLLRSVESQ